MLSSHRKCNTRLKEYISIQHTLPLAKDTLSINWNLTNICNFKCSYCSTGCNSGTKKSLEISKIIGLIDKIIDHYPNKKKFFEFTGGEVTFCDDLLDIAGHIKSRGSDVGILSNGKRELSFWHKLNPLLDHVCLSYHPEYRYEKRFLEVVECLGRNVSNIGVHINVMMKPELFDDCLDIANRLCVLEGITLALQPLYKRFVGERFTYTTKQLKILHEQVNALTPDSVYARKVSKWNHSKKPKCYRGSMKYTTLQGEQDIYNSAEAGLMGLNNYQGLYCYAGLENLTIDYNGNVRRSWCKAPNTYIGNINTDISFPTTPILCEVSSCFCGFDMMCTKKAPHPRLRDIYKKDKKKGLALLRKFSKAF